MISTGNHTAVRPDHTAWKQAPNCISIEHYIIFFRCTKKLRCMPCGLRHTLHRCHPGRLRLSLHHALARVIRYTIPPPIHLQSTSNPSFSPPEYCRYHQGLEGTQTCFLSKYNASRLNFTSLHQTHFPFRLFNTIDVLPSLSAHIPRDATMVYLVCLPKSRSFSLQVREKVL